ncbi:MAG: hypothetical protein K0S09_2330 [Sphingobacteriaceae bacterium]|jgi:hypothetical protein|nr:hypothetical protein [Sphingobacteriaceae bacterium]
MKNAFICLALSLMISCKEKDRGNNLDPLAERYVKLGLIIGQYDADFVDAYYGPDSLKPVSTKLATFPKDSLLKAVDELAGDLKKAADGESDDTLQNRANWMQHQLKAFGRRIRIFSGEYASFDEESHDLFGAKAPVYPESHYRDIIKKLDGMLSGTGDISQRFQALANRFIIPKEKLDTVFKTAIAESRKRTLKHYKLPSNESFTLSFVTDKPWSGYNWYKGNYRSEIQINTDMQIFIERAIDVGSHESYPGHHVYNMLLEEKLYRQKGWVEISLYPLFSPQSLIAEGSANYGIEVAFPGNQKTEFARNVLLPLAGLDTTGIDTYFKAIALKAELNYAGNEAARGLINGTMTEAQALKWLQDYCLYNQESAVKRISFIKKYRSYVINYNYGQDLVKNYVESRGGTASNPQKRWEVFGHLLSNQITPEQLLK